MEFKFNYNDYYYYYINNINNNNNNNTLIRIKKTNSFNRIVFLWLNALLIKCKDTRSVTKISQSPPRVNYDFTLGDVK
jgi:hypothetical protein